MREENTGDLGLGQQPVHGQLEIVDVEGLVERGQVGHAVVGQGQAHVAVTGQQSSPGTLTCVRCEVITIITITNTTFTITTITSTVTSDLSSGTFPLLVPPYMVMMAGPGLGGRKRTPLTGPCLTSSRLTD